MRQLITPITILILAISALLDSYNDRDRTARIIALEQNITTLRELVKIDREAHLALISSTINDVEGLKVYNSSKCRNGRK